MHNFAFGDFPGLDQEGHQQLTGADERPQPGQDPADRAHAPPGPGGGRRGAADRLDRRGAHGVERRSDRPQHSNADDGADGERDGRRRGDHLDAPHAR